MTGAEAAVMGRHKMCARDFGFSYEAKECQACLGINRPIVTQGMDLQRMQNGLVFFRLSSIVPILQKSL